MSAEFRFIDALRALALDPGARGLMDDAAVLDAGGPIVVTHDMLAEGVHFLPDDPPDSVAWKLVAVNLSDLGAKGAEPLAVLVGYSLGPDADWDAGFVAGLAAAMDHFGVSLLGGDTIRLLPGAPRVLGLTAIGRAPAGGAPVRGGAQAGDMLFVTGTIGDAALGLDIRRGTVLPGDGRSGEALGAAMLVAAYQRPCPPVAFGRAAAPHVHAMMDVSDGLLIDARRMADASGCALAITLDMVPMSPPCRALRGGDADALIAAATGGDDYQLLLAAPPAAVTALRDAAAQHGIVLTEIGRCHDGRGIALTHDGRPVPVPARLGWEHV